MVPDGIVTVDGTHHRADIICYATGFRHNDFLASMRVTGRHGISLRDQWGDEPTAYLGITVPNFPNLFCIYGPGTNLASGASLFYHSEFQVHYAMEVIHETLSSGRGGAKSVRRPTTTTPSATRHEIGQLVWSHPSITHSHYKNRAGQGLHVVPVAARPVLGVDPAHGSRPLPIRRSVKGSVGFYTSRPLRSQ